MSRLAVTIAALLAAAMPASVGAQSMPGMDMRGMKMPAPARQPIPKKAARKSTSPPRAPSKAAPPSMAGVPMPSAELPQPMTGHDAIPETKMGTPSASSAMPGMEMPGDAQPTELVRDVKMTGTALPAGDAAAPPPPADHYADRQFPRAEMARARGHMMRESGAQTFSRVMFNLAEVQVRKGHASYRWDGEGWFGGDINRLVVKTEGEGGFREGVQSAEVQALYSQAVGPYFDLQAGVRHDFQPSPPRTYATVGFEGLAPYWFEVEGALFVSNTGDVLGRLEGYYDQRITQRLILQPRVELNLAAGDVPDHRLGAGLTDAELGLRLRYELSRKVAPYIGISYEAKTGRTAKFARGDGKQPTSTSLVAGVRFWF